METGEVGATTPIAAPPVEPPSKPELGFVTTHLRPEAEKTAQDFLPKLPPVIYHLVLVIVSYALAILQVLERQINNIPDRICLRKQSELFDFYKFFWL